MVRKLLIISCLCTLLSLACSAFAQSLDAGFYDIGSPTLVDYYVDPLSGNDNNAGTSQSSPKRSVTSVWNDIPQNSALSSGYRINLLAGTYTTDHLPNYWENRIGTAQAPIILRAVNGYGSVFFTRDINMAGVSYFYLLGVDIKNQTTGGFGDPFHCERCDHLLLRGNSFNGAPSGRNAGGDVAHETIKVNQSRNIFIENNNIQGAEDNGIDFVAVAGGHVRANRIHDTQSWGMYVKGGSANLLLEGNIVYNCFEGGITAGQGTGFEFMDAPYLRYEANYIKIVNNIVHDVSGAALGVNGGYNVLIAHNTAYRIGSRSHLLEVVFGERSCDGNTVACQTRRDAGGWGPAATGFENSQPIGNRNVLIFNNVLYNPAGFSSGSQHFAIYGPRVPTVSGIPNPQVSDSGLQIKGNLIWNGTISMPLGVEDGDQGCQPGNASCTASQLLSDNSINNIEPDFISPGAEDFRPISSGALANIAAGGIDNFAALEAEAGPIPEGERNNLVPREFSGALVTNRPPGAIASSGSSISFPAPDSGVPPGGSDPGNGGGGNGSTPTLKITKSSAKRSLGKVVVSLSAQATDADGISSVIATLKQGKKTLGSLNLKAKGSVYSGKKKNKTSARKIVVEVVALDSAGQKTLKKKTLRVK